MTGNNTSPPTMEKRDGPDDSLLGVVGGFIEYLKNRAASGFPVEDMHGLISNAEVVLSQSQNVTSAHDQLTQVMDQVLRIVLSEAGKKAKTTSAPGPVKEDTGQRQDEVGLMLRYVASFIDYLKKRAKSGFRAADMPHLIGRAKVLLIQAQNVADAYEDLRYAMEQVQRIALSAEVKKCL